MRNITTSPTMASPVQEPWGFVIYRTTYTAESNLLWPAAVAKFNQYIKLTKCVHIPCKTAPTCNHPASNTILSDATLYADKGIDDIANIFAEYIDSGPPSSRPRGTRADICLVIDKEVLEWLKDAPEPIPRGIDQSQPEACIKAVDIEWDPEEVDENEGVDERYQGWAKVPVHLLQYLHVQDAEFSLGQLVSMRRDYWDGRVFKWKG